MFFDGLNSVEEIKKLYRDLVFRHHPDMGGDLETMQQLNAEYKDALQRCQGQEQQKDDGDTVTYNYRENNEQAIIEILDQLISLQMENIEIYIIGVWVWVLGDTKPYKEQLKKLKLRWHSTRKAWYYKPYKGKSKYSDDSLDSIASRYGAEKVGNTGKQQRQRQLVSR